MRLEHLNGARDAVCETTLALDRQRADDLVEARALRPQRVLSYCTRPESSFSSRALLPARCKTGIAPLSWEPRVSVTARCRRLFLCQGQGSSPDIVVEAPKDQQVAGAVMLRESTLQGAFTNPGPLGNLKSQKQISQNSANANSVPIKAELIGTPDDAQLKAALAYLASDHDTTGAPPG